MTSLPLSALWYARHGWRVFPAAPKEKLPAIKDWPKLATTDIDQIARWWQQRPDCNVGLACGPGSGVYVIDVDIPSAKHAHDGRQALLEAERKHGQLPDTLKQTTGSGGKQLLFRWPDGHDLRNKVGRGPGSIGPGVDTRGNGGFVVLPPSIHPDTGLPYRWRDGRGPHQHPLQPLPDAWIKALVRLPAKPRSLPPLRLNPQGMAIAGSITVARFCSYVTQAHNGERNMQLFKSACRLAQAAADHRGVSWPDAEYALHDAASLAGLDPIETRKTIASAERRVREGS